MGQGLQLVEFALSNKDVNLTARRYTDLGVAPPQPIHATFDGRVAYAAKAATRGAEARARW
jgi:hypothetical protein